MTDILDTVKTALAQNAEARPACGCFEPSHCDWLRALVARCEQAEAEVRRLRECERELVFNKSQGEANVILMTKNFELERDLAAARADAREAERRWLADTWRR